MSSELSRSSKLSNIPIISKPSDEEEPKSHNFIIPKIQLSDADCLDDMDSIDPPPLTPGSDCSTDEPFTEEITVEEVMAPAAQVFNEGEAFTEDLPNESDTTESEAESFIEIRSNLLKSKVMMATFVIWCTSMMLCLMAFSFYNYLEESVIRGPADEEQILKLIHREKWAGFGNTLIGDTSFMANNVIVTHTETPACVSFDTCINVLQNIKGKSGAMEYNFLVASDGYIYEALGWQMPSPLYPDSPTMVVAFIGNYEKTAPSVVQLIQFQKLLAESTKLNYLRGSYSIYGHHSQVLPKKLYTYIALVRNWGKEQFDTDEDYVRNTHLLTLFFDS